MSYRAIAVAMVVVLASVAHGGPNTITYQGSVLNDNGTPAPDGNYNMRFSIFTVVTGGVNVWQETDANVAVTNGLFSTTLGDGTVFGPLFANNNNLWLEVEIDLSKSGTFEANEKYAPRQKLAGAAWAINADTLDGIHSATLWRLTGNGGTTSGTHFLGTTDNRPLDFRVNGVRALRIEPNSESANIIGGHSSNLVTSGVYGATIGGGGGALTPNRVTSFYGTIGGGINNIAAMGQATVGGGAENTAHGFGATVGGGTCNLSSGTWAATIGGGAYNEAIDDYATVAGGRLNQAAASYATVGGGINNEATSESATVAGGTQNVASGQRAAIGGGLNNIANGNYTSIAGGNDNRASAFFASVGGGDFNNASAYGATVSGGSHNTASGERSMIAGGESCLAAGHYSFAAGRNAKANGVGSFAWADSTTNNFNINNNNRFGVRASGGVYLYSSSDLLHGSYLAAGSGTWAGISDRNVKENVVPVNADEVLGKVAAIPISTWNYTAEGNCVRHMGPMAQDLYAAFGLGDSDKAIATIDADGVALAAIQGLYMMVQQKDAQIATLKAQKDAEISELKARLAALEKLVTTVAQPQP